MRPAPHNRRAADCYFAITTVWPGLRWTWEFVFMGPAHTVTGIHYDFPINWFCQVTGTKEFMLFPPDQSENMCESEKYDWGATLSDINISKLADQPGELSHFNKVKGIYARVEAGDALFVPSKTWHCVVALEPSIRRAEFERTRVLPTSNMQAYDLGWRALAVLVLCLALF